MSLKDSMIFDDYMESEFESATDQLPTTVVGGEDQAEIED